jgi:hypothetical protein
MSADNGVYISTFPKEDGTKEYRVTDAQAIENVKWEEYVREYFENAFVFSTEEEAVAKAVDIYKELPICEYGISMLPNFPKPINQYPAPKEDYN